LLVKKTLGVLAIKLDCLETKTAARMFLESLNIFN